MTCLLKKTEATLTLTSSDSTRGEKGALYSRSPEKAREKYQTKSWEPVFILILQGGSEVFWGLLHLRNSHTPKIGDSISFFHRAFIEIWSTREVWRARGMRKSSKLPNFLGASYLDERSADVWTNSFITFSTRWFKCCKRVNIPSATLQRVDNFVSGKHFATLSTILS